MNERIRELAEQAGFIVDQSGHIMVCFTSDGNDEVKKFAELIIQECLRLNKTRLASIPDDQKDWDGHNYGMTAAVYGFEDLVKEHFGVEE